MGNAEGRRNLNRNVQRLTQGESCRRESLPEGVPFDVLHRDVVLALTRLIERVDRADVGVIERADAAWASCSKRRMRLGSHVRSAGRSFKATLRPRRNSVASQTSPMSSGTDEGDDFVGTSRVPACRGMCWRIMSAEHAGPAEFSGMRP
jgi:predicted GTPase